MTDDFRQIAPTALREAADPAIMRAPDPPAVGEAIKSGTVVEGVT